MVKKSKIEIPAWIYLFSFIYWFMIVLLLMESIEEITIIIPCIFIAHYCGTKCYRWAYYIKKNKVIAFLIGFGFSLFGLLVYYIYYKIKK